MENVNFSNLSISYSKNSNSNLYCINMIIIYDYQDKIHGHSSFKDSWRFSISVETISFKLSSYGLWIINITSGSYMIIQVTLINNHQMAWLHDIISLRLFHWQTVLTTETNP